jgi:hypothetical protein
MIGVLWDYGNIWHADSMVVGLFLLLPLGAEAIRGKLRFTTVS